MQKNEKQERLASIIQSVLTPSLVSYAQEFGEEFGVVSVVRTQLSPDGSWLEVIVQAQENEGKLVKFLAKMAPQFRHEISQKVSLYRAPQLRFSLEKDTSAFEKNFLDALDELHKHSDL